MLCFRGIFLIGLLALSSSLAQAASSEFAFLVDADGVHELSVPPPPPPPPSPPPPPQGPNTPVFNGYNFLGNTASEIEAGGDEVKSILISRANAICYLDGKAVSFVRSRAQDCQGEGCPYATVENGVIAVLAYRSERPYTPTYIFDLRCR